MPGKSGASENGSQKYWIGTVRNADLHNVTLAGVTFPKYSNPIKKSEGLDGRGQDVRVERPGAFAVLDRAHVDRIVAAAEMRVTRMRGTRENGGSQLYVTKALGKDGKWGPNPRFRSERDDRPIAEQVYMVRADQVDAAKVWDQDFSPPTLAESMAAAK